MDESTHAPGFGERLKLALKVLFDPQFAASVSKFGQPLAPQKEVKRPSTVENSALVLVAGLQREGRLIDFIQQDVAGFSDEDIGAGARVVHAGCRKIFREYFVFEPALPQTEGTPVTVPAGFDGQRIRVTGNVTGQPPFRGVLKHQGWVAKEVRLPVLNPNLDARVVAAAEVELT